EGSLRQTRQQPARPAAGPRRGPGGAAGAAGGRGALRRPRGAAGPQRLRGRVRPVLRTPGRGRDGRRPAPGRHRRGGGDRPAAAGGGPVISLWHFLAVGAALFGIGLVGFLTRRNLITMFLCAEMMVQGVILNLLAFGKYHGHVGGQVFALFIVTVAACEAALALALFLTLYRRG